LQPILRNYLGIYKFTQCRKPQKTPTRLAHNPTKIPAAHIGVLSSNREYSHYTDLFNNCKAEWLLYTAVNTLGL